MTTYTYEGERFNLAPYIQHTLIAAGITKDRIISHAHEAAEHGFNAAMVPGSWVEVVADVLKGTNIKVASALDFPTAGVTTTAGKAAEAESLVRAGVDEIDFGVQVGWLKSGMRKEFRDDIAAVVAAGVPVKVMLELPLLTESEREIAVELAIEAGAAFLKNASAGAIEVATPESVRYLIDRAPEGVKVKASGGITSVDQAYSLIEAGASLLGTSAGMALITNTADENTTSY